MPVNHSNIREKQLTIDRKRKPLRLRDEKGREEKLNGTGMGGSNIKGTSKWKAKTLMSWGGREIGGRRGRGR